MKRSMDDVRYVPGSDEDDVDVISGVKPWSLKWVCPNCLGDIEIKDSEIENSIESEERDPDIEYLICPVCKKGFAITNGCVFGKLYESSGVVHSGPIVSDGYHVYIEDKRLHKRVRLS